MSKQPIWFCLRFFILLLAMTRASSAHGQQWQHLPPTPDLPKPEHSATVAINGVRIWYALFGHGSPVILLHGGMGNSNYWGLQIPALAQHYQVIVLDSRGHGRSTRNSKLVTYHLMASDVLNVMDALHVSKAALVGWSDGGIIGLDLAINHPERLTKLFAFGANSDTLAQRTWTRTHSLRITSTDAKRNIKSSHRLRRNIKSF